MIQGIVPPRADLVAAILERMNEQNIEPVDLVQKAKINTPTMDARKGGDGGSKKRKGA